MASAACKPPPGALDRPGETGAVRVDVGVFLIDVSAVDDAEQSFTADLFVSLRWRDPRLGATVAGCRLPFGKIWHPQLDIVNRRFAKRFYEESVQVDGNGEVSYRQRLQGEFSSAVDLRHFPFDRQELSVTIASFGYGPEDVELVVDEPRTGRRQTFSVAGWRLGETEARLGTERLEIQERDLVRLDLLIEAERDVGFYLWKIFLPLTLIVFMAWTVFWIDPSQLGPQIGVSTASVFTLIAFLFSLTHLMPRVSYLTRADRFVLLSTVLVFLALAEAILTSRLAQRGHQQLSLRLDHWARATYPLLFALLAWRTLSW